jgi:mannose-6-phosphate isomerase-like protein (cupin superfamily)
LTSIATPTVRRRSAATGLVKKPWGYELRWAVTDRYVGKLIHIDEGQALSLQYHIEKDEAIFVLRGSLELLLEDDAGELRGHRVLGGMSARVLPGRRHRFVGVTDVDLIEVSSPELDDVVRLEDRYGRVDTLPMGLGSGDGAHQEPTSNSTAGVARTVCRERNRSEIG